MFRRVLNTLLITKVEPAQHGKNCHDGIINSLPDILLSSDRLIVVDTEAYSR